MSRLCRGAGTLAAVTVLLAGCGSSSKPLASTRETVETTASAADGSATTTANGDTNATSAVADSGASPTVETTPTSDAFSGLSAKCKEKYASYLAKVKALGSSPTSYKDLVPLFKELLAGAPPDVQAAAQPSLDAFTKFSALIDKYNGDIAKASQDPDFAAIEGSFTSADSQANSKKVDDWLRSTCGG